MIGFLLPPVLPNPKAAIADAGSSSAEVRWVAALALGRVDGDLRGTAVTALETLRSDVVEEVRAQAVEGLAEQCAGGAPLDVSWVISSLSDVSPAVRCAAVDAALLLLDSPKNAIVPLVEDPDPSVRMAAAGALGDVGDTSVCESLYRLLKDEESAVRFKAASALALLGDRAGEPLLIECLGISSDDLEDAVRGLGLLKSARALHGLRNISTRLFGSTVIKVAAAVSLYACTDGAEGKELICRFLQSKKADTRINVLSALCRLPIEGLSAEVVRLLKDKDEMIASAAIQTLVALASVDPAAANALLSHRGIMAGALAKELADAIDDCAQGSS